MHHLARPPAPASALAARAASVWGRAAQAQRASPSAALLLSSRRLLSDGGTSGGHWTSLLDDDTDAQKGNAIKNTVERKMEEYLRREAELQTPPELRRSVVNAPEDEKNQIGIGRKWFMSNTDAEFDSDSGPRTAGSRGGATGDDSPVRRQMLKERREAAAAAAAAAAAGAAAQAADGAGVGVGVGAVAGGARTGVTGAAPVLDPNVMSPEEYHYRASAAHSQYMEREASAGGATPNGDAAPTSAMSRFFRQQEVREFAGRKYEDSDKAMFGHNVPTYSRDMSDGGRISLSMENTRRDAEARETPYDAYRKFSATKGTDKNFDFAEKTQAVQTSIPGLGVMSDAFRAMMEQSAEAGHKYATRRHQIGNASLPLYKRLFADVDVGDKRMALHACTAASRANEWVLAIAAAATVFYLTEYQYNNKCLDKYDEFLGIEVGRGGEQIEYLVVMCVSAAVFKFFLFHPLVIAVLGTSRVFRHLRGVPITGTR